MKRLEAIRKRPGMYVGDTGDGTGLHNMVFEVVENAVNEALAGFCNEISVVIHADNSISVGDNGRGIATNVHADDETKRPVAEVVMTEWHPGRKYGNNFNEMSGRLHGMGVSAVNALSEWLCLTIRRDGRTHQMEFRNGNVVAPLKAVGKSEATAVHPFASTEIHFLASAEVFGKIEYHYDILARRLRKLSSLKHDLKIVLADQRSGKEEYFTYAGIKASVYDVSRSKSAYQAIVHKKVAKIGITGARGLLGYHLRALLYAQGVRDVRLADRTTYASAGALDDFVQGLDGIAHFAGMNRGDQTLIKAVNRGLAEDLVAALERQGARPVLVYANSTHIERDPAHDTPYGHGKRAAAQAFEAWAARSGARFCDLVLPNVFGEFGRPFYNSVVSTFCHQIAKGEPPQIDVDATIELVHAQDVARRALQALGESGRVRVKGVPITVSELLAKLTVMHQAYRAQVVPALPQALDVQLFNTLRSYLFPAHYPVALELKSDVRGSLFEVVKSGGGGQVFMSTTHPGVTRGNHYHTRKIERFLVAGGEAEIRLRKLFTREVVTFRVNGSAPCYIDMPAFHTHNITNVGSTELTTLFWANEIFDPADSDTYAEPVDPS